MGLLRNWRRRRLLKRQPVPADHWCELCSCTPLLALLDAGERERLRELAAVFLAEKSLVGLGGVRLTENQSLLLAAFAVVPILNLDSDWYQGFREILVYPGEFIPSNEYTDELGLVHVRHEPLSGEAWLRGPVILSWPDVETSRELDGYNVVIHEFAHKIDMLDGSANGLPPLHGAMDRRAWSDALSAAYDRLNSELDAGKETVIDPYAAENPAEFFAVLSEMFFECPLELREEYPAVYEQFVAFYRQDPARRFSGWK